MLYLLVFCSGFAGLVYEVLWMKQLGLLFGNTSHAAAVTLAAFFGGLTVGSWLWGRRCRHRDAHHGPARFHGLRLGESMSTIGMKQRCWELRDHYPWTVSHSQ